MTVVLVLFVVFLVVCCLAPMLPDRDLDDRDRRGWWPGRPR